MLVRTRHSCRCSRRVVLGTRPYSPEPALQRADRTLLIRAPETLISDPSLRIRSYKDAAQEDLRYQQTKRPDGHHLRVRRADRRSRRIVIVYQVLSTDVADHLREYATFKAMGYGPRFFLGIVFEEALVPGSWASFQTNCRDDHPDADGKITTLPLGIHLRGMTVFLGTIVFSALSGAIATRRLGAADPADLF